MFIAFPSGETVPESDATERNRHESRRKLQDCNESA